MPEEKPTCPFCESSLLVRLGNETHCNSCGKSFDLDKNPVASMAAASKRQASPATGYAPHQHENAGMEDLEAELNQAEAELREASWKVLLCKSSDSELSGLRQIERDARAKRDSLLQVRADRTAQKAIAGWPKRAN
jgi:hypothetical protein